MLKEKGGRGDVIKLVSAYETALYGIPHMRVANSYESRRQAAMAEVASTKLKAAAAASAIALVQTKLLPGESTDGAVFFDAEGKAFGPGSWWCGRIPTSSNFRRSSALTACPWLPVWYNRAKGGSG